MKKKGNFKGAVINCLFFQRRIFSKFPYCKSYGKCCRNRIGDRCRIHNAVNSEKHRKNDHQRQKENNLAGQRDEDTPAGFSDGREEIRCNRLNSIDKSAKQENPEKSFSKLVVCLAFGAENPDDLPGKN